MTTTTDYAEALRDARNALRYWKQKRTYTKAHLQAWCELAEETHPDTGCVNADLRNAYVHGCIMGYEFPAVFGAPRCYDRLQADAFMAGVAHGETCWMGEHEDDL